MATYPPIGDRERDAALARITARHRKYDDSRWSEAGTEARDVLNYLRLRRSQSFGLPIQLAADNTWDELVLSGWVYWDDRRRERELLHSALRRGLSLSEVGRYLGITSRQGARDYLDRLDALLADHARVHETAPGVATGDGATDPLQVWARSNRAQRGADVHTARERRAASRARPTRQSWIAVHHGRIAAAVTDLLAQLTRLGLATQSADDDLDAAEPAMNDYLSWLLEDHHDQRYTPGTFASLGLILGELRGHPDVACQADNHGVRRAISAIDLLRADLANLSPA